MKKEWVRALVWLPVVLWMAVIFCFSAQGGERSDKLSSGVTEQVVSTVYQDWDELPRPEQETIVRAWHKTIRKCAHAAEFALLGALFMNAWAVWQRRAGVRQAGLALLCGLLYAGTDEIHQAFVPSRGPSVWDVGIDFGGVIFGTVLVWGIWALAVRHKAKREFEKNT